MSRVAVIAAMPGELLHLARGWKHEKCEAGVHLWRTTQGDAEWIAACAGAGQAAATRAFAEVEKDGPVTAVISTGWAGALNAELVPGRVYAIAGAIDAQTGERFEARESVLANGGMPRAHSSWRSSARNRSEAANSLPSDKDGGEPPQGAKQAAVKPVSGGGGFSPRINRVNPGGFSPGPSLQKSPSCEATPLQGVLRPWLVTNAKVAGRDEKRRLAGAYPAGLVDMEAAAVARLAAMRGIPFFCIKGVSDGHTARLPDFNRFLTPEGHFQLTRFIFFTILRPWYWPELIRMSENSSKASQALRDSLLENLRPTGAN